ncbi:hypothetical protein ACFL2H_13305, partial [Planctomycetota bacterium]
QFWQRLSTLMNEEKYFTAKNYVAKSSDTAEQVLWERWTSDPDGQQVRFIANVLSQEVAPGVSWNATLDSVKTKSESANEYQSARTNFTKSLQTEDPSKDAMEQLRTAARRFDDPLAMVDALHLLALGEFAATHYNDAASYLLQAIELAEKMQDGRRTAELWLMASINSNRSVGQSVESASAWTNAVDRHAKTQATSARPLNTGFWLRADRHKPSKTAWPESARQAMLPFAKPVGCTFSDDSPVELLIWSAIGRAQLANKEPQLALVNFKKAERYAQGDNVMWLRIIQSECLAGLGQHRAATTLLCGPLASKHAVIPHAASAALGSAKLQAGTFQQGAQLLTKALKSSEIDWPARSKAEADLALVMLIIGETDRGLDALHAAQRTFESKGDLSSLLLSLENEKRLLEHEGKADAATRVRQHIRRIENRSSEVSVAS